MGQRVCCEILWKKRFWQREHWKSFVLPVVWKAVMCFVNAALYLNCLEHVEHLWGLSSEWTSPWARETYFKYGLKFMTFNFVELFLSSVIIEILYFTVIEDNNFYLPCSRLAVENLEGHSLHFILPPANVNVSPVNVKVPPAKANLPPANANVPSAKVKVTPIISFVLLVISFCLQPMSKWI